MEVNLWNKLPYDLIHEVVSYGDPIITVKYRNVLDQLIYYKKEFDYNRNNTSRPNRRWYNVSENDYYKYALRETFLKKNVNKFYGDLKDNNSLNQGLRILNLNFTYNNTIIDTIIDTNILNNNNTNIYNYIHNTT